MSRSHDIAAELSWFTHERDQWKECADQLYRALMYYARSRFEEEQKCGVHFSSEQNAARLYRSLVRGLSREDDE